MIKKFLGYLKTLLYRKPAKQFRLLMSWGPRAYFRIVAWKHQMEEAALSLPPVRTLDRRDQDKVVKLYFMTGAAHWYQTAFCAWSYSLYSDFIASPVIISDGTLLESHTVALNNIFPSAIVLSDEFCRDLRNSLLPPQKYPVIHQVVSRQLLFRKLTDVFCASSDNRLFLDSDMLFYRHPGLIDQFLVSGTKPLVQADCWESYGYSRELCERLTGGRSLPIAINIGVLGMKGSLIDWDMVEYWLGEMIAAEGWKYNITQCTAAMILSYTDVDILPANVYQVLPKSPSTARPLRILEHYVSDSKPYYFQKAWRGLLGI